MAYRVWAMEMSLLRPGQRCSEPQRFAGYAATAPGSAGQNRSRLPRSAAHGTPDFRRDTASSRTARYSWNSAPSFDADLRASCPLAGKRHLDTASPMLPVRIAPDVYPSKTAGSGKLLSDRGLCCAAFIPALSARPCRGTGRVTTDTVPADGNAGRRQSFSRNLLPSGQLDRTGGVRSACQFQVRTQLLIFLLDPL
jgi:hypothetical protein